MPDRVIRGMFDALVRRAGGVDAVAAVLEAATGVGHKGTVSKMCAGHIGITLEAVIAVEDFVGDAPITRRMAERLGAERLCAIGLFELATRSAVSAGAAQAALFEAFADGVITTAEAADVVTRMRALREVVDQIIIQNERIVAGGGGA
ncbi:hypothetical protein [Paragemmobacter ruber]|uniref:Uncharacterized protein n=1 Tax=Paragemmobacter ruber TaxID=1985673 RepID=A0ABW9Y0C9_9RHOB|nr:hypothetical protein [Rhodobacter ruber]NBE05953.1 hypothetical protein [Rhodobacter ruber]